MGSERTQTAGRELAAVAGLLADGTRAAFCLALLDGRAWTAGELARHAGVAAPTATGHLNRLVGGGGPPGGGGGRGEGWWTPPGPGRAGG
ncbi:helix-turn-helix domain-containing protein, partial [Kitasatospora arboriphila]